MISYEPFYRTLKEREMTEYQLIYKHGFSSYILYRMKHGETITLKTRTLKDINLGEIFMEKK